MTDWQAQHRAELRAAQAQATSRRLRSLGWFLLAIVYAILDHRFSASAASALAPGLLYGLVSRLLFVLLLLLGFGAMAAVGQRRVSPGAAIGLPRRPGLRQEWALGAALGWAGVVACVVPIALIGGLIVTVSHGGLGLLGPVLTDLLALLAATLADELLFRGYAFQRLIEVTGPTLATLLMTMLFTVGRHDPASTPGSILATVLLGFLLAQAYLRTRALWVGWGFGFAWTASMALLFGLPVSGSTEFSPVFSTYTTGSPLLTGGGYGPEGSALASVVLLVLLWVMARATRELRHRWAYTEIVGAGHPVDIDGIAERQHREGMGPAAASSPPAGTTLVQIAPALPEPPRDPGL